MGVSLRRECAVVEVETSEAAVLAAEPDVVAAPSNGIDDIVVQAVGGDVSYDAGF